MVAPHVVLSTAVVVDGDAPLKDFTPFLSDRVAAMFITSVQDWAPRCIGWATVLLALSGVDALFLTLGAAEFAFLKAMVSALKGRIIAAKGSRRLAPAIRDTTNVVAVCAAASRVPAGVVIWAVLIWESAARSGVRNTFAITFILVVFTAEVVGSILASVSSMARAANLTSITATAVDIWQHVSVDTAAIGIDVSVPVFITLAALFLFTTFLGVWVVSRATGLGLLGVRERRAVGVAVVPAAELVLLATPFVAGEVLAVAHGVVSRIGVVWVVARGRRGVVAAACHVLVLTV